MNGSPHLPARKRIWIPAVLVVVLVAGHGAMLYFIASHWLATSAVLSAAIVLLAMKHVGLLGPVYALFRRHRSRRQARL
jgi:membrane protein YdbS with pleckstrin-like domain